MSTADDTRTTKASAKRGAGFSAEERAAMRERLKEERAGQKGVEAEREVLAKIAEMEAADRVLAQRLHEIIRAAAPALAPRTWYGMPAYAKDGKILCYFRDAKKFKTRYALFGFSDQAKLDDGEMWPTDFALTQITPEVERRIVELLGRALG
ncbi:DUF1801 domain-containing protein [Conexibacter sp. S30A1]|uniref:DUF1801 domain-containing protein n=1 Tax=Conexibacter sp. S30A1 TaxID=2937800 RepID=UPI00200F5667|nr:DUF1801 domain-containing protein [Conexibacter sp. S30A1]